MFYPIKNRLLKTENTNRNYVASPNQGQERTPNKNTTSKTQTETMLFLMNIETNLRSYKHYWSSSSNPVQT